MTQNDGLLVAEFPKNARGDMIRVRLTEFNGNSLLDVRTWFEDTDGSLQPGKGFCCRRALLPKLISALVEAFRLDQEQRSAPDA